MSTVPPSYLVWSKNGKVLRGRGDAGWVDGSLVYPVGYPGQQSATETITLQSSASLSTALETFQNVKLYLTGDPGDIAVVQGLWPYLGDSYSPARPEMNGGFEISFDGSNFIRFSKTSGWENDPSTWITLPSIAMGTGGEDGVLAAYTAAQMYVRYTIPSVATLFKTFNIQLAADVDIV